MVTAKIKQINVGDKDYIWINIEFNIDGKIIEGKYPLDFKNVIGKTPQEITSWIDTNIYYQMDRYIEAVFREKVNTDIVSKTINSLIGKEYTKENAELTLDKAIIIAKSDGTYTLKA